MSEYTFNEHFSINIDIMNKVGQTTSDKLRVPTSEERLLRAKLIFEEAMETIQALGTGVQIGPNNEWVFVDTGEENYNPKEVLDGVCDLAVVSDGTLISCGLYEVFPEALGRIDQNNFSKVRDGVIKNADGKYQKPPGYKPVVLEKFLREKKII
jgi:predicted HAD superfamily Cof-like phosphohydrolase